MDRHQVAADALAQRLAMTISLSSVPMVEEWMDDKLARWLESVPAPMEMSSDSECALKVEFDTNLQRLTWSALGTPAAFIPKLARYLDGSGAQSGDLDRINAVGEAFEPRSIGSWIRVVPGVTETGWCFEDSFDRRALREVLEPATAVAGAFDRLADLGIDRVLRFEGALAAPAVGFSCLLGEGWADSFVALVGAIDGEVDFAPMLQFFSHRPLRDPLCRISVDGGTITRVALVAGDSQADDLAALCNAMGVSEHEQLGALRRALGSGRTLEVIAGYERAGSFVSARVVPGNEATSPTAAN